MSADVASVLDTPDLVRFLTKYGAGPPYLAEPGDEVIWRLTTYINRARLAVGLSSLNPEVAPETEEEGT